MCAKIIKEMLDKKFGPSWHVVVGEGFGFELSYEVQKLMYMFYAPTLAVCVWKCSRSRKLCCKHCLIFFGPFQ